MSSVYKDESVCEKWEKCFGKTCYNIVSRRNLKCKSEQLQAYYITMRRTIYYAVQLASIFFNAHSRRKGSARPQVTNDHAFYKRRAYKYCMNAFNIFMVMRAAAIRIIHKTCKYIKSETWR